MTEQKDLWIPERECWAKGNETVCGCDEAGAGPLAGPVYAAAVVLPRELIIPGLNDSKKLSAARREALYEEICQKAVAYGVGLASAEEIDELNILQATYLAMKRALDQLSQTPAVLLNDAVTIPGVTIPQVPIVKGDAKSLSIAAASVLAKVTRDQIMTACDPIFPEYGFARHKGYGTAAHIEALRAFGPCSMHRRTFIRNFHLEGSLVPIHFLSVDKTGRYGHTSLCHCLEDKRGSPKRYGNYMGESCQSE